MRYSALSVLCASMTIALLATGCGGPNPSAGCIPVSLTVTMKGQPVEGAQITFSANGEGARTCQGTTDKTGKAVIADETQLSCGVAAEFAAILADEGFASLKAPVKRVAIPNVPIPYHEAEEIYITPTAERIVEAVKSICK